MITITVHDLPHEELVEALRHTLGTLPTTKQQALRLLLDYDHGKWFSDERFVERVVQATDDGHGVQVWFDALAQMLPEVREPAHWTTVHGSTAGTILWLACELAEGRMSELAAHSDPGTDRLINRVLSTVFYREPLPGTAASEQQA